MYPIRGLVYVVPDPGDMNEEEQAYLTFLQSHYGVEVVSVTEFVTSLPDTGSVSTVTIFNNQSSLPSAFYGSFFLEQLKNWLMKGGNVVLFGNTAELLDLSGITGDVFESGWNNHDTRVRIINTTHPISEEYSLYEWINLADDGYLYYSFHQPGSFDPVAELGYMGGSNYRALGEVPYGGGTIVFSPAGFRYASDGIGSLAVRIIDWLQTGEPYAGVGVEMSSPVPDTENEVFEIDVMVTAQGGTLPIEGVVTTLTIPSSTTIQYSELDGMPMGSEPEVMVGTMSNGQTKHVVYGLECSTLGVKDFSVAVTTDLTYYDAYDELEKVIHRAGALTDQFLVVDINDEENDSLQSTLSWMGYLYDLATISEIANNGISSSYSQLVIFNNASSLPPGFGGTTFHNRVKDYLNQGGNVVLFGNTAELLDLSGITGDVFESGWNNHDTRVRIINTTHPISEEYSLYEWINLADDGYLYYSFHQPGSFDPVAELGYMGGSNYRALGEVPYGGGTIVFSPAGFRYASDGIGSLAVRIIDWLQTGEPYAGVGVEMSSPVPDTENEVFEIDVMVTAQGGTLPIEGVVTTLTIPSSTTIQYSELDGMPMGSEPEVMVGTMSNGQTKHVVYGLECSTLGVKDFSVAVTTDLTYYDAYDELEKVIHRAGALTDQFLVVDINDEENDSLQSTLSWMGYLYDLATISEIANNGISSSYSQLVIFNNASSLPPGFGGTTFHNRVKDYLNQGGNVVLFGNTAELLDLSGITGDVFESGWNNHDTRVRIINTTHPISEEYSLYEWINLADDGYLYYSFHQPGSFDPVAELGYMGGSNYRALGEVPYGGGTIVFSPAGFRYASDGMGSLAVRIIDWLQIAVGDSLWITQNVVPSAVPVSSVFSVSGVILIDGSSAPVPAAVSVAIVDTLGFHLEQADTIANGSGEYSVELMSPSSIGEYSIEVSASYGSMAGMVSIPFPFPIEMEGQLSGSEVALSWNSFSGASAYWVYGAINHPHFEPELTSPYQHRVDVLPSGTTAWSSSNGVGDADNNWVYLIVAVDASEQELTRSNRVGEHEFDIP